MSQKCWYSPKERFAAVEKVKDYIEKEDCSVKEACEAIGVAPSSYRRWRDVLAENNEYVQRGEIPEKSKKPARMARQVSGQIREMVVQVANQDECQTANQVTRKLKQEGTQIGTAKVIEILEAAGMYGEITKTNSKGESIRKRGLLKMDEGT